MRTYRVNDPKKKEIILKNISLLRDLKRIKQETMAMELGISKSEYSKLETGKKQNWEKHWEKIGDILGVNYYELALDDCLVQTENGNLKQNNMSYLARSKDLINEKVYAELDERDKLKDELLAKYRSDESYWKEKYYRMKALYLKAKAFIKNLRMPKAEPENANNDLNKTLGNVGG